MPATELLCQIMGINPDKLAREEVIILEAEIFTRVCDELREFIKDGYRNYFRIMKFNAEMECEMLEGNFLRCIINDILLTEEYTLSGIAYYTQSPEDVIYEITVGNNNNPSMLLSRKIIELHRSVRPTLYREIIKKIAANFLSAA
ncbi:MAG: hypothetical protein ABI597_01840 [Gammaproteobacteria bacterium]